MIDGSTGNKNYLCTNQTLSNVLKQFGMSKLQLRRKRKRKRKRKRIPENFQYYFNATLQATDMLLDTIYI